MIPALPAPARETVESAMGRLEEEFARLREAMAAAFSPAADGPEN